MARALIVGCGCRGRALGAELRERGWQVRGTTRGGGGAAAIERAGLEAAEADPARPGTILELVGDVAVVHWLLGSAVGADADLDSLHGEPLRHLLARLVDTPVRGFVYEAAGAAPEELLAAGAEAVRSAGETWRIPVEVLDADPADHAGWLAAALTATDRLLP
jgi:nucleoside-diphosphate-sugar epimerase